MKLRCAPADEAHRLDYRTALPAIEQALAGL